MGEEPHHGGLDKWNYVKHVYFDFDISVFFCGYYFYFKISVSIVIRNGKITRAGNTKVWKHGSNRPFFLFNLSSENY